MSTASQFVWFEHNSADPTKAVAFYSAVIGWQVAPFEAAPDYKMIAVGEQPIGGCGPLSDATQASGTSPHWVAYIAVADVAATCSAAQNLGAKVLVEPTPLPGSGQFAVLTDPQGATFGIFGDDTSGDPPARTDGFFSWGELAAANVDDAWAFYSTLFAWQNTATMEMGPSGPYKVYGVGGQDMGGMFGKHADAPSSYWLHYITVADLDATLARVKSQGGSVTLAPMQLPGGDTIAQCLDDQGAAFALFQKAKP